MKIELEPGKYIVAVSGGVDSMTLLHMLQARREDCGLELVAAHLDHGIRPDAAEDVALVKAVSASYGLLFEMSEAYLGPRTSEAVARTARYDWLHDLRKQHNAQAIVTAHHQDDVLETVIINLLRGTGRRGLSSLRSNATLVRPLLAIPKQTLRDYALNHQLSWREDSTNSNETYLRNYVRRRLVTRLGDDGRARLLQIIGDMHRLNTTIDAQLKDALQTYLLDSESDHLDRDAFIRLPNEVAAEVMAAWLRLHDIRDFDRKTITRLSQGIRQLAAGKQLDISRGWSLHVAKRYVAMVNLG